MKYGITVADPGFPVGGRGPPMWALFGENVCENERIGSHRGHVPGTPPLDPPMDNIIVYSEVGTISMM